MGAVVHPLRVGVTPAREHRRRARLLGALEAAYPVRFEARDPGACDGLDGLVTIGGEAAAGAPHGLARLVALAEERPGTAPAEIALADSARLDRPLRGARLHDASAVPLPAAAVDDGDAVLGALGAGPVWVARPGLDVVAVAPAELGPAEPLRERLLPGRCLALLALAQFVRRLTAERDWRPPPLRAAFVIDDPNLHWPTYGHLRYRELLAHAVEHRYHLAVAMVPLDGWLVHPGTARLFRAGADHLSVLVHGNDHDGGELGRVRCDADGVRLGAQALRRIERFERRAGVRVSRVMAPPHESVSEPGLRGLFACGYEAVCTTRPFPWVRAPLEAWLTPAPGAGPLAGYAPGHAVAGGLPVILRLDFRHPREDLALRAFLGQPLVLYGHHGDLAAGLDLLAEAAGDVNRLGDVRWTSLQDIARTSARTAIDGATLHVQPLGRRVSVPVPPGVSELRIAAAAADGALWRVAGATARVGQSVPIAAAPGATIELEVLAGRAAPADTARPRLWPLARRLASESRDRLAAV